MEKKKQKPAGKSDENREKTGKKGEKNITQITEK